MIGFAKLLTLQISTSLPSSPMPNQSSVARAAKLDGELDQLSEVVANLSDQKRMRKYADWLTSVDETRGKFLAAVVDAWEQGEGALPSDETIDMVWQKTCGITFLQKLREQKLDSVAPSIIAMARPALIIEPELADGEMPIGTSKYGGKPDVLDGFEWPSYEEKLHTFLGQIRLEEMKGTVAAQSLPDKGMLYFFVFDDPEETGQPAAEGAEGAWQVVYSPDAEGLTRLEPPKAFDEYNRVAPECVIKFSETLDLPNINVYDLERDYWDQFTSCRRAKAMGLNREHSDAYEAVIDALMPEREERSHLVGWSHPQVAADDPVDDGFRHLLTVASEEILEWCWADGHQLYFSVSDDDFESQRFDRCAIIDG
ncbi:DUF1963 domain-containing protein [Planctomycetes bacterium SV_7m_r]